MVTMLPVGNYLSYIITIVNLLFTSITLLQIETAMAGKNNDEILNNY